MTAQRVPLGSLGCPAQACGFILCLLHVTKLLRCLFQCVVGLTLQVLPQLQVHQSLAMICRLMHLLPSRLYGLVHDT